MCIDLHTFIYLDVFLYIIIILSYSPLLNLLIQLPFTDNVTIVVRVVLTLFHLWLASWSCSNKGKGQTSLPQLCAHAWLGSKHCCPILGWCWNLYDVIMWLPVTDIPLVCISLCKLASPPMSCCLVSLVTSCVLWVPPPPLLSLCTYATSPAAYWYGDTYV